MAARGSGLIDMTCRSGQDCRHGREAAKSHARCGYKVQHQAQGLRDHAIINSFVDMWMLMVVGLV